MIKRKISSRLEKFYEDGGKYALLVDGARQVGKTYIIREFAKTHYESFIEINFIKMKGAREIFENVEDESLITVKVNGVSYSLTDLVAVGDGVYKITTGGISATDFDTSINAELLYEKN